MGRADTLWEFRQRGHQAKPGFAGENILHLPMVAKMAVRGMLFLFR
jgi:hypothetical protein